MRLGLRTVTQILGKIYPNEDEDEEGSTTTATIEADAADPPTPGTTTS